MPSINVSTRTKAEFDRLKPEGDTQDAFLDALLRAYQAERGEILDAEAMVRYVLHRVAPEVELAAYRGIDERLTIEKERAGIDPEEPLDISDFVREGDA